MQILITLFYKMETTFQNQIYPVLLDIKNEN